MVLYAAITNIFQFLFYSLHSISIHLYIYRLYLNIGNLDERERERGERGGAICNYYGITFGCLEFKTYFLDIPRHYSNVYSLETFSKCQKSYQI